MKTGYSATKPDPVARTGGQWQLRINIEQVERQQDDGSTVWEWRFNWLPIPRLTEADAATVLVNAVRDAKVCQGVPYTFPDATTGTVQTRNEQDLRNIQVNAAAAQAHIINGNPTAAMQFRDAENVTHQLTAEQMQALTMYVADVGQAVYGASWDHKDYLAGKSLAEILQYDFDAGWPV